MRTRVTSNFTLGACFAKPVQDADTPGVERPSTMISTPSSPNTVGPQQHVALLSMWQCFGLFLAPLGFIRQPVFERSDMFDPSAALDHRMPSILGRPNRKAPPRGRSVRFRTA